MGTSYGFGVPAPAPPGFVHEKDVPFVTLHKVGRLEAELEQVNKKLEEILRILEDRKEKD